MPRKDLIDAKLNNIIRPGIESLKAKHRVLARIGSFGVDTRQAEIAFQEERERILLWALKAPDSHIREGIHYLENQLTTEELACKYGEVGGLTMDKILILAMIEDLEIALGIHPGVK